MRGDLVAWEWSWVPDVRARSFINAVRRQSKAVAASKRAQTDQGFIDAVSEHIDK